MEKASNEEQNVKILRLPNTVDIRINGVCNLNCAWCWGPVHSPEIETVSNGDWKRIIAFLQEYGVQSIVITGGEPVLRRNIREVLEFISARKMRVTLSTNGMLLGPLIPLLPHINDIGLPIDGESHESNAVMRESLNPKMRHFDEVLKTIKYVQETRPEIRLTVRTVISAKNHGNVAGIGKVLLRHGVDPKALRWKVYQVNPVGPRHDVTIGDGWMISDGHFREVSERILAENPEFPHIQFQSVDRSIKRYLLLNPSGDAMVLGLDADGHPTEIPIGNVNLDFRQVLENLAGHQYFPCDKTHGV